ncbi:unnamed protein product [Ilex paraguariensis]|uniref:Uncharacterized protein n=1 Tax=Ilex paraguariensis TaxID=185542 RepID=A0ABC8SLE0_9AQUA
MMLFVHNQCPSLLLPSSSFPTYPVIFSRNPHESLPFAPAQKTNTRAVIRPCFAPKNETCGGFDTAEEKENEMEDSTETLLYSFTPLPVLFLAALPGEHCHGLESELARGIPSITFIARATSFALWNLVLKL